MAEAFGRRRYFDDRDVSFQLQDVGARRTQFGEWIAKRLPMWVL